jgi:hypothetical protein
MNDTSKFYSDLAKWCDQQCYFWFIWLGKLFRKIGKLYE